MALLELCWKVKKTGSFLDRCKVYTVPVSIYSQTFTKWRGRWEKVLTVAVRGTA